MEERKADRQGKPQRERSLRVISVKFIPVLGMEDRLCKVYQLLLANKSEESQVTGEDKLISRENSGD